MNKKHLFLSLFLFAVPSAKAGIELTPKVFDFGWAPDNAIITCEVGIKNTGSGIVPLMAVQPSCGCTAADFTAEDLSESETQNITLTFNTRGYAKYQFDKPVSVKAGNPEESYEIRLKGHVADPNAPVRPTDSGIAAFTPDTSRKQTVTVENKSSDTVKVSIVQPAASWAKIKAADIVGAGQSAEFQVSVDGSLKDERTTSVTFEAVGEKQTSRFTIAIRTGGEAEPYRRITPSGQLKRKPLSPEKPASKGS